MTDAMLEQFLAVEQSLAELEKGHRPLAARWRALKQSQRDFERYLHSHCQVVLRAYDSGTGAAQAQLACEVDLLQQRAELLKQLAPSNRRPRSNDVDHPDEALVRCIEHARSSTTRCCRCGAS